MTFSRVNAGGWALYETLTSAQMNQLDTNVSYALDGASGGDYSPSSDLKVHGKIIGEDIDDRQFFYPLGFGLPDSTAAWTYNMSGTPNDWASTGNASKLMFSLNRLLHNEVILRNVVAYVDPGTGETTMTDRISIELRRVQVNGGAAARYKSYFHDNSSTAAYLYLVEGHHDGGDGQATLSDSNKSWTVNELVGGTVYNLTDGSSGSITANAAATITATLSGGTDNDWDDDDRYYVYLNHELDTDSYLYNVVITHAANTDNDSLRSIMVTYTEGDYLLPP